MNPRDVELVRIGGTERRILVGVATAALLLLVAAIKPWPGHDTAKPTNSASPAQVAAGVPTGLPSPSPLVTNEASALCMSSDRWLIVADDSELGRSVRTWLVATVEYSAARPIPSTIAVTTLVSAGVTHLGFCLPATSGEPGYRDWSGTLWRQNADPASSMQWQVDAELDPAQGAPGALANPVDGSAPAWPPGLYLLEARFAGLDTEAWLGLRIQGGPS